MAKISANPIDSHVDCLVVRRRRKPRDVRSAKFKEAIYRDNNDRYIVFHNVKKSILIAYKSDGLNDIKVMGPIEGPIIKTVHQ